MNKQLYLAPVRGITDMIYRNALNRHFGGIDVAVSPFLTVVKGDQIKKLQLDELKPENNDLPVIPQIIGKSAPNFITLSKTLLDIGTEEVNWNLGCPHPTMTKKKHGSGLLPHPDLIKSFLDEVLEGINVKLSVKVRLGLDSPDDLEKLMPVFNQYPLTEIIIHPRIGKQMYKGEVDLETFKVCMDLSTLPVVYNGDIYTVENYENMTSRFPQVEKVMLGRGVFQNPFLAHEIKTGELLSVEMKREKLKSFHDELFDSYKERLSGDAHLIQKMVGHWEYLFNSIPSGKSFYKKLKKVKDMDKYCTMVNEVLI